MTQQARVGRTYDGVTGRDTVEFDLHGLAGIRLLDATDRDAATVRRQVGPIDAPLLREPDVVIRFVDRLPMRSPVTYLGVDDAAYDDERFFVLRGRHKSRIRVSIPFEQVGGRCEIVCERGPPAVPLLIPILNLAVLANGGLAVHAAAFMHDDVGVLVTGWSKGGKTETLLAFAAHGATYVGDEWVYLDGEGQRMHGLPEPVRLWDWHLREMPEFRGLADRRARARLQTVRLLSQGLQRLSRDGRQPRRPWSKSARRLLPLVQQQLSVQVSPARLFGSGASSGVDGPHRVLFVVSGDDDDISVRPADASTVARRIAFSNLEERAEFSSYYGKFRFAFPEASNDFLEDAAEVERDRLLRVLGDKQAYVVRHPYPVRIPSLYDAIHKVL